MRLLHLHNAHDEQQNVDDEALVNATVALSKGAGCGQVGHLVGVTGFLLPLRRQRAVRGIGKASVSALALIGVSPGRWPVCTIHFTCIRHAAGMVYGGLELVGAFRVGCAGRAVPEAGATEAGHRSRRRSRRERRRVRALQRRVRTRQVEDRERRHECLREAHNRRRER